MPWSVFVSFIVIKLSVFANAAETETLTINDVNQWLNSLHVEPTSTTTVDVNIGEDGFNNFDSYQIEYTTSDQPDQWKKVRTGA